MLTSWNTVVSCKIFNFTQKNNKQIIFKEKYRPTTLLFSLYKKNIVKLVLYFEKKKNAVKSKSKQKTLKTQWKSICINCWNISIIITNWHAISFAYFSDTLPVECGCFKVFPSWFCGLSIKREFRWENFLLIFPFVHNFWNLPIDGTWIFYRDFWSVFETLRSL